MTNNKNGAGKFFLGALLGSWAGALAGRFVATIVQHNEGDESKTDGDKRCSKDCKCDKKEKSESVVKEAEIEVEEAEIEENPKKVEKKEKKIKNKKEK